MSRILTLHQLFDQIMDYGATENRLKALLDSVKQSLNAAPALNTLIVRKMTQSHSEKEYGAIVEITKHLCKHSSTFRRCVNTAQYLNVFFDCMDAVKDMEVKNDALLFIQLLGGLYPVELSKVAEKYSELVRKGTVFPQPKNSEFVFENTPKEISEVDKVVPQIKELTTNATNLLEKKDLDVKQRNDLFIIMNKVEGLISVVDFEMGKYAYDPLKEAFELQRMESIANNLRHLHEEMAQKYFGSDYDLLSSTQYNESPKTLKKSSSCCFPFSFFKSFNFGSKHSKGSYRSLVSAGGAL
ncbi:hypothetical protein EIN_047370 [Entamoeba invadens IP1]|uniref:VHS domain-containing protein n=1 Tax=Entamoeba invadens IP1 TaxID=370355 RepID=A0A0A1UDC2_ENTIV|nr:hypothetical protein EIN_047370 [Entamoeba invadens IP1]ELP94444.1 hypothetical protein EIN_047370 [Entamoeba invadens IP1]|eukprot:XP_004261215.1 hypothetical protein EIN_047370 [Entamoeba invadens IP1]